MDSSVLLLSGCVEKRLVDCIPVHGICGFFGLIVVGLCGEKVRGLQIRSF